MRRHIVLSLIGVIAVAGCLGAFGDDEVETESVTDDVPDVLAPSEDPLFENPQTYPHPGFGYPTVTNPPQDGDVPEWWEPIPAAEVPEDPTSLDVVGGSGDQVDAGAGIAIFGKIAIVPSWQGDTAIFDISDPAQPELLSSFGEVAHRDVDTIAYPDGRLVAVFATDKPTDPVWNITDPENPEKITDLEPEDGSHNVGVVPGTPIVYNANSNGGKTNDAWMDPGNGEGITEIYDLSDPEAPKLVKNWENGYGCHDISFHVTEDEQRAYCAGHEYTQIWDVSEPRSPEVVVSIPVHHGNTDLPALSKAPARFSHLAIVNQDASVLVVGDEPGGGLAAACDVYLEGEDRTASGPVGNLYFYDLSDEEDPEYMGHVSPNHHYPTNPPTEDQGGFGAAGCTAHFGRIVPDADQDLLAMAWYGAGVTLVDFTDPANPVIEDQWNEDTNTWDVWYYQGRLFTGDLNRGLDVLELG